MNTIMSTDLTNLLRALSQGDTYSALIHLQTLQIIDNDFARISNQKISTTNDENHDKEQNQLIRTVLPLTSLATATKHHSNQSTQQYIHYRLTLLRANLHPLPNLHSQLGESTLVVQHENFNNEDQDINAIIEDASTALAISASTDLSELTEIWNQLISDEMNVDDPILLSKMIHKTNQIIQQTQSLCTNLSTSIAHTHTITFNLYQSTAQKLFHASQSDTIERSKQDSADQIRIQLLAARVGATTAKLRLLRSELRSKMYTSMNVSQLQIISQRIQNRKQIIEKQLDIAQQQLLQCKNLGLPFEQLACSYREAKQVLEEKTWSKNQLMQ